MVSKKKKYEQQSQKTRNTTDIPYYETMVTGGTVVVGEEMINISPSRIRFQHSRIRPYFSGCGRGVMETLEGIRRGELEPCNLPPLQVLVGPDENDGLGPWYFSLNNRRLWVLKQCHREGLLDNERYNNLIAVRVRVPRSVVEAQRYTIDNCALEAKFTREGCGGGGSKKKGRNNNKKEAIVPSEEDSHINSSDDSNAIIGDVTEVMEGDSDSDDTMAHKNPFSALL